MGLEEGETNKMGKKKLTNARGVPKVQSVLRHEHLKNLSFWSIGGDYPILSLATLFGRRLAANGEASGIPPGPDLVSCQRCVAILQPGFNCNVRIEKASPKKKRSSCKKYSISLPRNNVVYYCNFCSHHNHKRGTAKSLMKEIYPSKTKTPRSLSTIKEEMMMMTMIQETQSNMFASPVRSEKDEVEYNVVNTPKPMLTLDRDKRIRRSKSKKPIESEKTVG